MQFYKYISDGAAVMSSAKNGVLGLIKSEIPHIQSSHDSLHKLSLCIDNSVRNSSYSSVIE